MFKLQKNISSQSLVILAKVFGRLLVEVSQHFEVHPGSLTPARQAGWYCLWQFYLNQAQAGIGQVSEAVGPDGFEPECVASFSDAETYEAAAFVHKSLMFASREAHAWLPPEEHRAVRYSLRSLAHQSGALFLRGRGDLIVRQQPIPRTTVHRESRSLYFVE